MISFSSAPPAALLAVFVLSSVALAGQLFVERYGLDEVARGGDAIALGVVESTGALPAKEKGKSNDTSLELRVEKVWGESSTFEPGKVVKLRLYGGVVWDDPHKSPIDRRLDGGGGAKKGDRVIAVPSNGPTSVELLPATADNVLAANVLFDEGERAKWLASSDDVLRKGLGRSDLATLALAELQKRGSLGVKEVLSMEQERLFDHVRSLDPAAKRKLLDDALPLAKADPALRDRVFQLAAYEPDAQTVGALAPLIALYDPAKKEDRRRFDDVHLALVIAANAGAADLSPFAPFLVDYERTRPSHKRSDDDFEKLAPHLDAGAKAAVAIGFLEAAHASTFSGKEIDQWLLAEAADLAKAAPAASIVPALTKVDPGVPRVTSEKERAMTAMLEIGTAIVTGVPSERERVRAILEPLLARRIPAEDGALAAWRAAAGDAP